MKVSEIRVIKKDGTKEDFNVQKVVVAVNKSANRAMITFSQAELNFICQFVEEKAESLGVSEIPIAQMHNLVEGALEKVNPQGAKSYRDYRNYKPVSYTHLVGLIPENELSIDAGVELDPRTRGAVVDENFQTSVPGIFAAGNVLHVHDLVDFVCMEAESLADSAAAYIENGGFAPCGLLVKAGEGIGHTIPQKISGTKDITLSMRPSDVYKRPAKARGLRACACMEAQAV